MSPISNGMPDCSAKPSAAPTPESGTGITMSASTGCSSASRRPSDFRAWYTFCPQRVVSGRAK